MLIERLAAMAADHEPGWRLPRRTELARRFQVSTADIDAAIADLAGRYVLRETPDGMVYRASPAECLISLDQLPLLSSRVDPMGSALTCASRNVLRRAAPEEIARVLRLGPGAQACAVQSAWAADGTIAAVSTTYLPLHLAIGLMPEIDSQRGPAAGLNYVPSASDEEPPLAVAGALSIEVQPPPRWAARLLRLRQAEPAITVTVRLDHPSDRVPLALTSAVLHPARFRLTMQTPDSPMSGGPHAPTTVDHLTGKAG